MGGMGDMKDERDIRTGRAREASQWPYPPRMDTPLWLQPLCTHQRRNRSSTQTRGEDTWMPAQICSFLGSTEISSISSPGRKTTLLFSVLHVTAKLTLVSYGVLCRNYVSQSSSPPWIPRRIFSSFSCDGGCVSRA